MSGLNLKAVSENASRLGMRLQETFSERTRDFSFSRRTPSLYLDTLDERMKVLGRQLDSSSDREKLDALKRLIAVGLSVFFQGWLYRSLF
jgi:AP-3 complex subunit beta